MYVGVIRGDMPGPLFLADLEPTSQTNFPIDPKGQTVYLARPNPTTLTNFLGGLDPNEDPPRYQGSGGVPAGVVGTAAITFPLTLTGSNNVLQVQTASAGPFSAITIPAATYSSMTNLLAAVNTAMKGSGVQATTDTATGTLFILQSTALGVGAYIGYGATVANGSTFNTPANLNATATNFTMPSAATIIAAMNPVVVPPATGSLNLSAASILSNLGASPAAASAVQVLAPQFVETDVAIQSFQVGNLAGYLAATYNPNSRLLPALPNGPAIQVVQNDGVTPYTAPLPQISAAVHNSPNTGDVTITGVGLASTEQSLTVVDVWNPTTNARVRLSQALITSVKADGVALTGTFSLTNNSAVVTASLSQAGLLLAGNNIVFSSQPSTVYEVVSVVTTTITLATVYTGPAASLATAMTPKTQGVVTSTSIVLPAVLLNTTPKVQPGEILNPAPTGVALGVAGNLVQLRYGSLANINSGTAANIASVSGGVVTLTGLANMNTYAVGQKLTISAATHASNLGTFFIQSYISASSVTITNFNAVAESGTITWKQTPPVSFVIT